MRKDVKMVDKWICRNVGCRESFKHSIQMYRHEKACEKEKPSKKEPKFQKNENGYFKCIRCETILKSETNTYRHLKTCKQEVSKNIHTCNKCSKEFKFPSKLSRHMETHKNECYGSNLSNAAIDKSNANIDVFISYEGEDFIPSLVAEETHLIVEDYIDNSNLDSHYTFNIASTPSTVPIVLENEENCYLRDWVIQKGEMG